MLKTAYLLEKIGADTAENERNFAENLPKICNYPTLPLPYVPAGRLRLAGPVPGEFLLGGYRCVLGRSCDLTVPGVDLRSELKKMK